MDEDEFQRLLNMFPVVRSRDYNVLALHTLSFSAEAESSSCSASLSGKNEIKQWKNAWGDGDKKETEAQDAFLGKLRSAAEKKVGAAEAERFCDAFQKVYQKLVYEDLSVEAAQRLLNSS
ncbi:hypothetical protein Ancab_000214 [Ancistrocladus abbreviatus]